MGERCRKPSFALGASRQTAEVRFRALAALSSAARRRPAACTRTARWSGRSSPAGSTRRSSRPSWRNGRPRPGRRGPWVVTTGRWRRSWPAAAAVRVSCGDPVGYCRGRVPAQYPPSQAASFLGVESAPDAGWLTGCHRVGQAVAADGALGAYLPRLGGRAIAGREEDLRVAGGRCPGRLPAA